VPDQNKCQSGCPNGYFKNQLATVCNKCSQFCVLLSINANSDPLNEIITFTITFNQKMNFATFAYSTFHTITTNPSTTTHPISAFIQTPAAIDDYSYSIKVQTDGTFTIDDYT